MHNSTAQRWYTSVITNALVEVLYLLYIQTHRALCTATQEYQRGSGMKAVLDPTTLVETLEYLTERSLNPGHRHALAVAIGDDMGVARTLWQPNFDVVLRPVLHGRDNCSEAFVPTLLSGRFQTTKKNRKVRGRNCVISWLRDQELNSGTPAERFDADKRWRIPVPADSSAIEPLGGCIYPDDVRLVTTRPDGVEVKWYTLSNVQVGELVYRIDSGRIYEVGEPAAIRVTLYQRISTKGWVRVQFDGSYDSIDLPCILGDLAGDGQRFHQVERVTGKDIYLLRPAPEQKPVRAGKTVTL